MIRLYSGSLMAQLFHNPMARKGEIGLGQFLELKSKCFPLSALFLLFFQNLYNEYDFIVIGAGSAGSVVANRLTEVSDWKVLLLEAGGDESITSDIPGLAADLQLTNMDWQYKSVPQTRSCLGFTNQQ